MVRQVFNKTRKNCIYWYIDTDNKKKFAYRYKFYDHNGKRCERSKQNFKTEIDAEKALIALKALILNGGEKIAYNDNMTVTQWVDIYFDRKKSKWKITSIENYEKIIRLYIKPYIGKYKLSKLTKSIYESEFIDKLKSVAAPKSIELYHHFFVGCINAAVEDEIILRNRIAKAELPKVPKKNNDELNGNFLTANELQDLLKCVKHSCDISRYTLISLLSATGMRKGEASALKWSEIDFNNKRIYINHTRDFHGERPAKTSNSIRCIDMTESVAKQLDRYRKWCIEQKLAIGIQLQEDDYVFIGRNCKPLHRDVVRNTLIKMHTMYDIKLITPHGLRHTFATILISAGTPITTIAKILGNTPQTLMKTYAHSFAEKEKIAMQTVASVINFD